MSEDKKKWLGLGKDSNCRCLEFYTDLTQLCDTCPLKTLIPETIQLKVVAQAEDNRELMPPNQFREWIEGQIKLDTGAMETYRDDAIKTPELHYPNVLTQEFIYSKERAKALRRFIDEPEPRKAEPERKTPKKSTPQNPTQWQLAAYYRYLVETDYPTPFDDYKTQKPAFEEIAKRHSQYGKRSAGAFKQQWNLSNGAQRPHSRNLPDLRVVLEMLTEYPRAAEKCKMEIKEAETKER